MKVGVLGRTKILYDTVGQLKKAGHEIVFILTGIEAPEYTVTHEDFRRLAKKMKAPFMCVSKTKSKDLSSWIQQHPADIGVSVNWPTIIGKDILSCFKYGIINAHAGDLPRYKGNAAPNWAILSGEDKVVLTLHLMTAGLDAGPILLQEELPITADTYISHVYDRMISRAPLLFAKAIEGLKKGTIKLRVQPAERSAVLRCYPRLPRDGEIDWRQSNVQIARLIRASAEPLAGSYTFWDAEKLIVWRGRPADSPEPILGSPGQVAQIRQKTGEVAVVAGDGLIVLQEVEMEGTGRRKASHLIRSMRVRLGMDICGEIARLNSRVSRLEKMQTKDKR